MELENCSFCRAKLPVDIPGQKVYYLRCVELDQQSRANMAATQAFCCLDHLVKSTYAEWAEKENAKNIRPAGPAL